MRFSVYILKNPSSGFLYIGHTNDVARRLAEHNDVSRSSWSSRRGPWVLAYTEDFETRSDAMRREKYLKSLKSKRILEELIAGWRKSIPASRNS